MSLPLASLVRRIINNLSRSGRRQSRSEQKGPTTAAVLEVRQVPSATSLGVVDGNTLKLDANRANDTSGGSDSTEMDFNFGLPGDTILVGNWNGPGQGATPVVVRQPGVNGAPKDGLVHWYFDTNGDAAVERDIAFGLEGDTPVVGDWDGDGKDDIGVVRKSTGAGVVNDGLLNWFLKSSTSPTGYTTRKYGFNTDTPVVGNWDGVGGDDIGVVRSGSTYLTWLQNWTGGQNPDRTFIFGLKGDRPVVGDWDGNATDNAGVARTIQGPSLNWLLDTDNNSDPNISRTWALAGGLTPIVGDWKLAEITVDEITDGQLQPVSVGVAEIGQFVSRDFVVRNAGTKILKLGVPALSTGFTLEEGLSPTLAPGASDTFRIRFTPTAEGAVAGTVRISTNDGNEGIFDFSIYGATPAPEINVVGIKDGQSTAVDFGNALVDANRPSMTFRIENLGTKTLALGQPQIPAGFRQVAPLVLTSLEPKQYVDLVVEMDTSVVRTNQGEIVIPNNDANESPYNFKVIGVVSPRVPEINVVGVSDGQSTALDIGGAIQGTAGTTRTFEIKNEGTGPLTLSGVRLSNSDFSVISQPDSVVAVGKSTFFTIRLDTKNAGTKTAFVTIASNDSDEASFDFPIQGLVEVPHAEVTVIGVESGQAVPVEFGSVVQSTGSPTKTFTIRNDGNIPLQLGPVTVTQGFYFSVIQQPASIVEPGASTTFTIKMSSLQANGRKTATVSFTTNDPGESPFRFSVAGEVRTTSTNGTPEIEVQIDGNLLSEGQNGQLNLGAWFSNSGPYSRKILITNRGNAPLKLSGVSVAGAYTLTGDWSSPIAPGASREFSVSFNTTNPGTQLGNLSFLTNDTTGGESNIQISLKGKVFEPANRISGSHANAPDIAGVYRLRGAYSSIEIEPANGNVSFDAAYVIVAKGANGSVSRISVNGNLRTLVISSTTYVTVENWSNASFIIL